MQLEDLMKTMGRQRALKAATQAAGRDARTRIPGAHRDLLQVAIPLLEEALRKELEPAAKGARKGARALEYLRLLPPDVTAFIACRTIFDQLGADQKMTACAMAVGSRLEDEVRFRRFKAQAPGLYRFMMEKLKDRTDYRYKHKVLVYTYNRADGVEPWAAWPERDKLVVGLKVLDLLARTTGLVDRITLSRRGKKSAMLVPTAQCLEALAQRTGRYLEMTPWFLPMNQPPKPWTNAYDGGYWTYESPLVKGGGMTKGRIDIEASDLTTLLEGVNAIQATAWQVNVDVLVTVEELWRQRRDLGGLAPFDPVVPPPRPAGIPEGIKQRELAEQDPEAAAELKQWKRAATAAYTAECRRSSKVIAALKILEVADLFRNEERIYFPQQVDWRGRVYPLPLFLTPQGRDLSRGLLRFADGKPVGDEGGEWLAIHGANCWGLDKAPFSERVEWVLEHEADILRIAEDPLTEVDWAEADKPFQFLAWCLEWAEFAKVGHDPEFVSHLPVAMDGSCNGLQHFSAMLRDERGGAAVNLVPAERPQDIYAQVAQVVHTKVSECDGDKIAREWLASGLIDRSIVKRQVMTLPYGATKTGMVAQLMQHLDKLADQGPLPFEDVSAAAGWLTVRIWESINEVVKASRKAMDFLQECAKVAAREKQPVRWTTPHGLVIEQRYAWRRQARIKSQMLGEIELSLRLDTAKLDARKQAAAISPNFVHSLDGAHLLLTIAAMPRGMSWAMVHDSFGTHAGDAAAMARVLRLTFVDMYARDEPLAHFRNAVAATVEGELPELPESGNLRLEEVLRSDFFFA